MFLKVQNPCFETLMLIFSCYFFHCRVWNRHMLTFMSSLLLGFVKYYHMDDVKLWALLPSSGSSNCLIMWAKILCILDSECQLSISSTQWWGEGKFCIVFWSDGDLPIAFGQVYLCKKFGLHKLCKGVRIRQRFCDEFCDLVQFPVIDAETVSANFPIIAQDACLSPWFFITSLFTVFPQNAENAWYD